MSKAKKSVEVARLQKILSDLDEEDPLWREKTEKEREKDDKDLIASAMHALQRNRQADGE